MIHGRNLIVSIDGALVAGSKSCQFQISQSFIQVCAPTEGRTLNKKPTTYDWSMSVDCLISSSSLSVSLTDKLIAGTRVLLTFTDGSGQNRAGFAYVKSCDEGGSVGSLATFSASFEADGPLYKYTEYHTDNFAEGENLYIDASGDSVVYNFEGGSTAYGVQITPTKNSLLFVAINNSWVIYQETFANIKQLIDDIDDDGLNEVEVQHGIATTTIQLTSNTTYTILSDHHDNTDSTLLFLLYEV